jgi:succinate dehydrogenase flavin-adding protein (antitoxin of CptAB toxin-antitoxin module)
MLELDVILSRYLEKCFAHASETEQGQFRALLAVEDPVLNQWLILGEIPVQAPLAGIARQVRETGMLSNV